MSLLSLIRDLTLRGREFKVAKSAAFTLNKSHAGKVIPCDLAAGFRVTLPAPSAEYLAPTLICNTGAAGDITVYSTAYASGTATTTIAPNGAALVFCQPDDTGTYKWVSCNYGIAA